MVKVTARKAGTIAGRHRMEGDTFPVSRNDARVLKALGRVTYAEAAVATGDVPRETRMMEPRRQASAPAVAEPDGDDEQETQDEGDANPVPATDIPAPGAATPPAGDAPGETSGADAAHRHTEDELARMTNADLRQLAADEDVEVNASDVKADLIRKILAGQE